MPRTVLEAMAMGRPIITTDAPGCRETVELMPNSVKKIGGSSKHTVQRGKNGFLVPVKDVKHLAEAMEQFVIEPILANQMGAESLRIARQKYDVKKVNAKILQTMGI